MRLGRGYTQTRTLPKSAGEGPLLSSCPSSCIPRHSREPLTKQGFSPRAHVTAPLQSAPIQSVVVETTEVPPWPLVYLAEPQGVTLSGSSPSALTSAVGAGCTGQASGLESPSSPAPEQRLAPESDEPAAL